MTKNEQLVKSVYPKCRIERFMNGRIKGLQKPYYILWSEYNGLRLACEDTKALCWQSALEKINANKPR